MDNPKTADPPALRGAVVAYMSANRRRVRSSDGAGLREGSSALVEFGRTHSRSTVPAFLQPLALEEEIAAAERGAHRREMMALLDAARASNRYRLADAAIRRIAAERKLKMERRQYLQEEDDRRKVKGFLWLLGIVVGVLTAITLTFWWWG